MRYYLKLAFTAMALATVGSAAAADPAQLIRHSRIGPDQAANMTLAELFASKRGHTRGQEDDMIVVLDRGTPNPELLSQIAQHTRSDPNVGLAYVTAAKISRNASPDRQVVVVSTRGTPRPEYMRQMIARAGLTPEEAAQLSLNELSELHYSDELRE